MSEESPISEITSGFYHQTYHLWNNQRIISYHQTVSNSVECPALHVDPSIGIVTCESCECSEPIPTSQLGSSSGIDMYKTRCLNPGWTCSKKNIFETKKTQESCERASTANLSHCGTVWPTSMCCFLSVGRRIIIQSDTSLSFSDWIGYRISSHCLSSLFKQTFCHSNGHGLEQFHRV